ncbi:MAG: hypothetical protein DRG78_18990 [Epsilonproteobacteria bacterium]|nr:MAG: hypothetical protein DRG78_18990 [Campylobacterota bacterium]
MNFLIFLVNEGLTKIIPFITILIVANKIDVNSYGELTLYYIIFELLTILISNNIKATTRIDFFKLSKSRYLISKKAHIVNSILLLFAILIFSLFIDTIPWIYILILSVTSLMRSVSYFVLSDLQCKENAKLYGLYNLLPILFSNLFFIIFIYLGYGIESWFYTMFAGTFIQFLFILQYIYKNNYFSLDTNLKLSIPLIYTEFKNGVIFMPQAFGFWLGAAADRLIISEVLGTLYVGYYMFVFQLSTPIIIFSTVVNLYLTPKLNYYIKQHQSTQIKIIFFKFLLLTLIFSVLTFIVIQFVINYYYHKYIEALSYVPYIVIALYIQASYLILMNLFYYVNKQKFVSILILITSLIKVSSAYLAINLYNIYGLLYSNIFINSFILIFVLVQFKKSLKLLEIHNA